MYNDKMSQIYLFNVVWKKWKNAWIWFKKFIFLELKIGIMDWQVILLRLSREYFFVMNAVFLKTSSPKGHKIM